MQRPSMGTLAALLSAATAGISIAAGAVATHHVPPVRFIALCYMIAAPVNTLWWYGARRGLLPDGGLAEAPKPTAAGSRGWLWLAGHGLGIASGVWLFWEGTTLMDAAFGSLISRFSVVLTVLLGMIFLSEKFRKTHWLGFVLTIFGVALINWTAPPEEKTGIAYLLAGSLMMALGELCGKNALRYIPVTLLVLVRAWFMMCVLSVIWSIVAPGFETVPAKAWPWIVASALLGPVIARNLFMMAMSAAPISRATVLTQSQPVYAALGMWMFSGLVPDWRFWAGGAAIFAGNLLLILARVKPRRDKTTY